MADAGFWPAIRPRRESSSASVRSSRIVASASRVLPFEASAIPWACSQSAGERGVLLRGARLGEDLVHLPKRTITSSGSEAKKSIPGIMSSISGGMAFVGARARPGVDSSERPSIDAEYARKP